MLPTRPAGGRLSSVALERRGSSARQGRSGLAKICSTCTSWEGSRWGGRGKPCSSVKLETVKGRKSAKERATAGEEKVVLVNVE